jgi:hypothetical protein
LLFIFTLIGENLVEIVVSDLLIRAFFHELLIDEVEYPPFALEHLIDVINISENDFSVKRITYHRVVTDLGLWFAVIINSIEQVIFSKHLAFAKYQPLFRQFTLLLII